MKVLMLFNDYLLAGGERVSVATEVEALRAHGANVRLLQVENHRLQEIGPIGKMVSTFPRAEAHEAVSREIAAFRPDVVHAQNLFPQLGAGAIRAIGDSGTPWVRTIRNYRKGCIAGTFSRDGHPCHDCTGALRRIPGIVHGCYQGSRANSAGATNYAYWEGRSERRDPPARYIAISEALKERISPLLPRRVTVDVVHNAVDRLDVVTPGNVGERAFDVAYVGRLTAEKGVELALEVAMSQHDQAFAFVGDGALAAQVRSAAATHPNISLHTDLDHRGAAAIIARSRVVMVPSQWDEPFGRVAAEALAYGALPVVSAMGGLPEIVRDLPYPAVISGPDASLWSAGVSELLGQSQQTLDDYSRACVAAWQNRFSPSAVANGLVQTYEATVATDGSAR